MNCKLMKENQTWRNIFEITISVSICLKEIGHQIKFVFVQTILFVWWIYAWNLQMLSCGAIT